MTRWWWPWGVLVLLGAYHGLNPGMGWLFAVARGLQERRRAALWQSFLPIAIGHEAAIGAVVVLVGVAQLVIAPQALRAGGAGLLLAFAAYRIYRQQAHPRGFGMRVGLRGLFGWSFLMSSAHGAGLMLVPILLSLPPSGANQDLGLVAYAAGLSPWGGLLAATLHTAALLDPSSSTTSSTKSSSSTARSRIGTSACLPKSISLPSRPWRMARHLFSLISPGWYLRKPRLARRSLTSLAQMAWISAARQTV